MDSDISGVGQPIGPREKRMYEQEYKHGADLFQRALSQYTQSSNMYQKAEFKDVMDQALQVMNQTANSLMRQELQKQNEQITKDYANFQKFPDDPDMQQQLNQDLSQAKKNL